MYNQSQLSNDTTLMLHDRTSLVRLELPEKLHPYDII